MSPSIYTCPICGWNIYSPSSTPSWMNEFRGLYQCSTDSKVTLTGVGVYNDPHSGVFIAPPNRDRRYDDHGYVATEEDQFGTSTCEVNNRRGYPIHNVCWKLLEQAIYPEPVPIERFFRVLDSLTSLRYGKLDWGYKQRLSPDTPDETFPWERLGYAFNMDSQPCLSDPFYVDVGQILRDRSGTYDAPIPPASIISGAPSGNDPFFLLPEELCTAIATYLPTHDALNLRLASRSFWHLFDRQQFWASRFMGRNSELSWLFEVQQRGSNKVARDWRWLYHHISNKIHDLNDPIWAGLHNRRKIWAFILPIMDILELRSSITGALNSRQAELQLRVSGGLEPSQHDNTFSPLKPGCRAIYNQEFQIPRKKARVSVSTVVVGSFTYIAGLSLVCDSHVVQVGYTGRKEKAQSTELDMAGLRGINIAVGLGGIHALQFVDTAGPARWLGCPDDAAKTTRLGDISGAVELEVWFDAFRLVEVSVNNKSCPANDNENNNITLRNSAVWYPNVPPPHLNLNEDFFFPIQSYTWGFKPLFWTHFGGPGGIYLKNLRGISWDVDQVVSFESNEEKVPLDCRSFGRAPLPDDDDSFLGVSSDSLDIDGPGGERISAVEIGQKCMDSTQPSVQWLHSDGALGYFKIITNRGRSHKFGDARSLPRGWKLKEKLFKAPPGHIITGFYGAQYRDVGYSLEALGIITELEC